MASGGRRNVTLLVRLVVYIRREDAERFIEEVEAMSRSSRRTCGSSASLRMAAV
jgi:hypothetical protein